MIAVIIIIVIILSRVIVHSISISSDNSEVIK